MTHQTIRIQVGGKSSEGEGKPEIKTLNGVEHIVIPAIILKEGVLHSSNAEHPALALAEEFALFPEGWDGRPVVYNHPKRNDNAVSANSPDVWESEVIGQLFGTHLKENTKLRTNLWISKSKAPQEVIDGFEAGEAFEVSTGLFALEERREGKFDGRDYKVVWRNVVPDHLAVLSPGTIGACSIEDGCGAPRANAAVKISSLPQTSELPEGVTMNAPTPDSSVQNNAGACGCPSQPSAAIVSATPSVETASAPAPSASAPSANADKPGVLRKILDGFLGLLGIKQNELADTDRRTALELALSTSSERPCYIAAVYESKVVYMEMTEDYAWRMFERGYSVQEGGAISLGADATEVRPETQYIPLVVTTNTTNAVNAVNATNTVANPAINQVTETGGNMDKTQDTSAAPAAPAAAAVVAAPATNTGAETVVQVSSPEKAITKAKTLDELLNHADDGVKAQLQKIIKGNDDRHAALVKALEGKVGLTTEDLQKLDSEMLEKMAATVAPEANFAGAVGGSTPQANQASDSAPKDFTPPLKVFDIKKAA